MKKLSGRMSGFAAVCLFAFSAVICFSQHQSNGEAEIAAAKAAAGRDPQNWRVFNNLGLAYYRQAQYDKSVSAFQQALTLYSVTSILENEKKQKDAQDAQRAALEAKRAADIRQAKALQQKQEMNDLFGMISGIAGMQGNMQAQMLASTMQTINNQIDSVPNNVPPLSPEIKQESSLKSKNEVANIYIYLGSAYFGQKDYQQAIASFENALQLDPSRIEVLKTSAEAHYFLCKYDECIRTFAKYHAIAPVETASLLRLFDAYRALNMQQEADKAFSVFLTKEESAPADCIKQMQIGALCLSHWRYGEAIKFLTAAQQASGDSVDISRKFSEAQLKQFRTPCAIQILLAEAQFNLRNAPEAIVLLNDAVANADVTPKAWYMLAQCYDETGETGKALETYRKALDAGKLKDPAADYIQVCRAATGDGDMAVKALETQLENVPLTPGGGANHWYVLALALEKTGRIPEAMEIFNRCIDVSPSYTRARLALERLGRQLDNERQQAQSGSDKAMKQGDQVEAVMKLADAYRLTPGGTGKEALRKALLRMAGGMDNPPAMTAIAQDHYLRGSVALKAAKNPVDLGRALSEFQWAVFYSPWVGDLYFNTSAIKKLQNQTAASINDLKLHLAGKPDAADVNEILSRLYEFDYQREQNLRELAALATF